MIKILLIILGISLLARPLLRLVLGYLVKKGMEQQFPNQHQSEKPKGTVTIERAGNKNGEGYSDFEEVK